MLSITDFYDCKHDLSFPGILATVSILRKIHTPDHWYVARMHIQQTLANSGAGKYVTDIEI